MKTILTDARILAGADELTGHANTVELTAEYAALDATTFGSGGWRQRARGLGATDVKLGGFLDAGATALDPDAGVFAAIDDGEPVVVTVSPAPGVAYLVPAVISSWAPRAAHGSLATWQLEGRSDLALARGSLLASVAVTADHTAPAVALLPVEPDRRLVVAVHAVEAAGGNLTVVVESADATDPGFASPVPRAEFELSEPGARHFSVPGPIVHTLYRARLEVDGADPSFAVVVAAGTT